MGHDAYRRETFVGMWTRVVRRRWAWGVGVFVLIMGLATTVLFTARPVYRAEARLRLGDPPPQGGILPTSGLFGLFGLGGNPFANDMELLASRSLAEQVVADGSLNAALKAPVGWHRDSLLLRMVATPLTEKATFEVEWMSDGTVEVRQTAPREGAGVVARGAPGSSLSFGGVAAAFREWRSGAPREVRIKTLPFNEAVRRERRRIGSERTRREANVVEIHYQHHDPELTLHVVQSAVDRFVELRSRLQAGESGQTMDSLRTVADETASRLVEAELALEEFQRTSGLVAIDAQSEALVERYSTAVSALEIARTDLAAIDEVLQRVAEAASSAEAWTSLVSHPRFLQNETVGNLLIQLITLEEARAEVASRRTPENREHRVILDQIEYLDGALRSIAESYRKSLVQFVSSLEARVAEMDDRLARLPREALELGRRQREVRVLNAVVLVTEQRILQEELRQVLTFANVQVIDPAKLEARPVWPRKKLGLAVGFLIASVFGVLALAVAERADTSVRTEADVRAILGAPVLAAPHMGRTGRVLLSRDEAEILLQRATMDEWGTTRLILSGVTDSDSAQAVAEALREHEAERSEAERQEGTGVPVLDVSPTLDRFSGASAAASAGAPVVVVLLQGTSLRGGVERAGAYLHEAGANLVGVVMVCRDARAARDVWA